MTKRNWGWEMNREVEEKKSKNSWYWGFNPDSEHEVSKELAENWLKTLTSIQTVDPKQEVYTNKESNVLEFSIFDYHIWSLAKTKIGSNFKELFLVQDFVSNRVLGVCLTNGCLNDRNITDTIENARQSTFFWPNFVVGDKTSVYSDRLQQLLTFYNITFLDSEKEADKKTLSEFLAFFYALKGLLCVEVMKKDQLSPNQNTLKEKEKLLDTLKKMSLTTYQEVYQSKKGQSVILNSNFFKKVFTDDVCLSVINELNTGQIDLYKKESLNAPNAVYFLFELIRPVSKKDMDSKTGKNEKE